MFGKIDDSSGFHLAKLHPESRSLCCFEFGGRTFQYTVLPFGERKSPSTFQRCNMMVINFLRHFGVVCSLYLDDRMVAEPFMTTVSKEEAIEKQRSAKNMFLTLLALGAAGGFINLAKSQFEPTYELEFLGMILNAKTCIVSVPEEKWNRFQQLIRTLEDRNWFTLHELEELRGQACSLIFSSNNLKYFIREMTLLITETYANNKGRSHHLFKDTRLKFNKFLKRELMEWKNQTVLTLRRCWLPPAQTGTRKHALFTDSSLAQLGKTTKFSIFHEINQNLKLYVKADCFTLGKNVWDISRWDSQKQWKVNQ